ncbi:MAG TPA: CsbD family protein [Solimonas sp.]
MNSDTLKGQWKQLAGRAKESWGKLTDDELLKVEGNAQRLSGLVQERYGVTREEAESQVKRFIDRVSDTKRKAA